MFTRVRFAQRTQKPLRTQKKQKWALALALVFSPNTLSGLGELCGLGEQPTRGIMGSLLAKHQRHYLVTVL